MECGAGAWPARGIGPREGLRPGLVWPVPVDASRINGPSRGRARGMDWRRSSRGLYVPAEVDASYVEQRIVEAAALLHGWGGVTGWAGLRWLGGIWFNGLEGDGETECPVPLAAGLNHPMVEQAGFLVSNAGVPPHHLIRVDGVRVTTPVRSVTFEMRRARTVVEAAKLFAMAAYSDLVSIDELITFTAGELNAKTGVGMVRAAIPFLTENAWSPMEPEMFHHWVVTAGRPAPLFNVPVFDRDGRHIATPDLLDPTTGVCGEYQGDVHLVRSQRSIDVGREGVVRRLGLEPVTMVAADRSAPDAFTHRLDDAYARAARLPVSERLWTIKQPSWWIDTSTVARRRALTEAQRQVALNWRRTAA
jgi:hypothetical protein